MKIRLRVGCARENAHLHHSPKPQFIGEREPLLGGGAPQGTPEVGSVRDVSDLAEG
ncbi:hypothetical protein GO013_01610 [Pseudodesulfovibrio sp. JC047]|uniref:hypothetical protein n=1 Tax=Pseudodesulfovibrio sp. JC047 TaxID=2683199 RepID=UPI0013D644E6|nr:hypothetical protein [Pseudodesulfovibrio sp. JC047]NDV18114.1 hypothetical protein [Pseudodesulfovibrio sp. JC047]